MTRRAALRTAVLLGVVTLSAAALRIASAFIFLAPARLVPSDRLLKNISAYIQKHPNDAASYFTRGRVHYYLFATGSASAPKEDTAPHPGNISQTLSPMLIGSASAAERIGHLKPAILDLQKAIALRNRPGAASDAGGLYELCLACIFEQGAPYAARVGAVPGLAQTTSAAWTNAAIQRYSQAYAIASPEDLQRRDAPIEGLDNLISYEAGSSYLRMVSPRRVGKAELKRAAEINSGIQKLQKLPPCTVISPIIFSLDRQTPLRDLLADGHATVTFDLDGSGRHQHWSWVKPTTGILVWQPDPRVPITSGRQLFGNVTWWMFWQNGYRALDALDDNRDGWLTGSELHGLAVWCDRNQDGIAEPGEVIPVERTAIQGIHVRSTSRDRDSPMSASGLRLRDGRTLPTYDWMAQSRSHP